MRPKSPSNPRLFAGARGCLTTALIALAPIAAGAGLGILIAEAVRHIH